MNLHHKNALVGRESISLRHGMLYSIFLQSFPLEADEGLRWAVPFYQRNCLSHTEKGSFVTRNYTQSGCFLECKLRAARRACQTECIPWDFPPVDGSAELCDKDQAECVYRMMRDYDVKESCEREETSEECPMECNSVSYGWTTLKETLNVTETCLDILDSLAISGDEFDAYSLDLIFFLDALEIDELGSWFNPRNRGNLICTLLARRSSMVKIKPNAERITVVKLHERFPFSATLAAIGGIMGLFTGASLVSVAEMIVWSVVLAHKRVVGNDK